MPLTYDFRKRRVVKTRGHRKNRETVKAQQAKIATCMTCPEKEKVAENMVSVAGTGSTCSATSPKPRVYATTLRS